MILPLFSIDHLVATIAHCLWQGALAATILFFSLRLLPAGRANTRYLLTLAAMLVTLFAALFTYAILERVVPLSPGGMVSVVSDATPLPMAPMPSTAAYSPITSLRQIFPWKGLIGCLWVAGVLLFVTRTAWSVIRTDRLLQHGKPIDDPRLRSLLKEIAGQLHIHRPIQLLSSQAWQVPATAGILFPALLLPAELLANMPPGQLRAILAHELAHIRRHDYLVNFFQQIIEALLFFNPAIWWISRQVRIEREACCDALAVRITHSPAETARTLAAFADRQSTRRPAEALAITGREGSLLDRINRILYPAHRVRLAVPWYDTLALFLLAGLFLALLHSTATLTARAADELLTPQQRVEKIAEIQKAAAATRPFTKDGQMTITGHVRTADGSPLPLNTQIALNFQPPTSLRPPTIKPNPDGSFSTQQPTSTVQITAYAPDYAPVTAGPITPNPDGTLAVPDLALDRGYTAHIRLVDPDGNPLRNTSIQYSMLFRRNDSKTDADGIISIPNVSDKDKSYAGVFANVPGYQRVYKDVILTRTETPIWKLERAIPSTGIVLDQQSGLPLAGARIMLVSRNGPSGTERALGDLDPKDLHYLMAISDAQGRFTLNTLVDNSIHNMFVTAPDHGSASLSDISPGQNDIQVTLGPERILHGQIIGDLSVLNIHTREDGSREVLIPYIQSVTAGLGTPPGSPLLANIPILTLSAPIVNNAAHFEIHDVSGTIFFKFPYRTVMLPKNNPITINLDDPQYTEPAKRTINLILDTPPESPKPNGSLTLHFIDPVGQRTTQDPTASIVDGQASIEVATPSRLLGATFDRDLNLPGFWVQPLPLTPALTNIARGDPISVHLKTVPAGLARGRILNPDGTAFNDYCKISVIEIEKSAALGNLTSRLSTIATKKDSAEYIFASLPLGGVYRLVASSSARFAVSDSFAMDEKAPIHTIDLKFSEGQTVTGRILDPAAKPLANIPFLIHWLPPWGNLVYSQLETDNEGRFTLEHLNTDIPGSYELMVPNRNNSTQWKTPVIFGKPIEFQLTKGVNLRGTVINLDSRKPIPNASLALMTGGRTNVANTRTDENGNFQIADLPAGNYQLEVIGTRGVSYAPESVPYTKSPDGSSFSVIFPPGFVWPTVTAGQPDPVIVRVLPFTPRPRPASTQPANTQSSGTQSATPPLSN